MAAEVRLVRARATATALLIAALVLLCGCASLLQGASQRFAANLGRAVLDHDDPATVRDGLPAYLLLLEGMIEGDPDNAALRLTSAEMHAAYASSFVEDNLRARRLSSRALAHAWHAQCVGDTPLCGVRSARFDELSERVALVDTRSLRPLYALGAAWAAWIQAHSDDWNAIADVPKVQLLLERAVALEPGLDQGTALVYLGVLDSLRPAALGGNPAQGREWFEQALRQSQQKNLMAKTLLAEYYARLVFDRDLHDRLLEEVLAADPRAPGLTLGNTLAQERARELLDSSDRYF